MKAANYNYFEGVTIRNTDIGIWAGTQFIAGSKGLTVKKCRFENVNLGVFTNYSGSSDFYIANPDGSHAIDGPRYPPREYWDRRPVAIDFYNNYMTNFHDNAVEIDGSMHNVRVMRNMMVNSASHPFCNQPAIGGPIYWIRNIAYHAPGGSTRMTNGAAGVLFYNNTILTETSAGSSANAHWRNNLMLGENSAPAILSVNTSTSYSSSDYNGFRPNAGSAYSFEWNSARFQRLEDYSVATGQDRHSAAVDYDVFVNVPGLDAKDLKTVQMVYKAEDLDFRLTPDSAAEDRGVILPNVTDGFAGRAPDLGALEEGQPVPHYGPPP